MTNDNTCKIEMRVIEDETIKLDVSDNETISLDIAEIGYPVYPENYKGPYTVTPSRNKQVLKVGGMMASEDITVEPIPSNYGLISWNGAFITVS